MDIRILLARVITLIYRERLIKEDENSDELIRNLINSLSSKDNVFTSENNGQIISSIKETILDLVNNRTEEINKDDLKQRLRIDCGMDEKLFESIEQSLDVEYDRPSLKRSIITARKYISNYFREKSITEIVNKSAYDLKFNRNKIGDLNKYVSDMITQIEPLQLISTSKDPSVFGEIDLGDEGSVATVFKEINDTYQNGGILKFGWQDLNTALCGGIKRGEFCVINALQHKYKSGFSLSLFSQVARYNKPDMIDPTKKPLLLRISFEDSLAANIKFLYQYLKYEETGERIDFKKSDITEHEMAKYVKEKQEVSGFHIKFLRVDPSGWTYRNICNRIIELESEGYEIHFLMLDYLSQVPTTGCTIGPMGTDLRDLFRRMRNFCAGRKIACMTPHQLSTEAKQLIRNGVPEHKFVKELDGKGYYSGSKQLDQEVDIELYIHIVPHAGEKYLSVFKGKHRDAIVIPDSHKYFLLKFPSNGMPIPGDMDREVSSYRELPSKTANKTDEYNF